MPREISGIAMTDYGSRDRGNRDNNRSGAEMIIRPENGIAADIATVGPGPINGSSPLSGWLSAREG